MSAPYQKHSKTSKEAADSLMTAETMGANIIEIMTQHAPNGMTADELALNATIRQRHPTIQSGTVSARLTGLEDDGKVCQTKHTRMTRNNRPAHVWKLKEDAQPDEIIASRKTEREQNRETIEMAANFLSGLVKSKSLKFEAAAARCLELSDALNSMLNKKS